MCTFFKHFNLKLVSPGFDSNLIDILMELNHLRKLRLVGTTAPWIFFQLKEIFHLSESIGSARIEGNRTTISEYVDQKIEKRERAEERFSEIANGESAMNYIEETISEGTKITHHFIRELHQLAVDGLKREGDKTPGAYRTWNVQISQSSHSPPEAHSVRSYMDELIEFINKDDGGRYELLKTAIAHHRFAWIHPFGNGNGRVVRLLTYAMLIKYGFNVNGKLLNPTAVFCNDRNLYYQKLAEADKGDDKSLLNWCEYVLSGILEEIAKVNKLLDFKYLYEFILLPTIELSLERKYITDIEANVLRIGIKTQEFKASDLSEAFRESTPRQRTHQLSKMKNSGFITPIEERSKTYYVNFMNNYLMRSLVMILEKEGFVPAMN